MLTRIQRSSCAAAAAALCVAATVHAAPTVIDFESFTLGGAAYLDTGPVLTFDFPDVRVTMTQGADFRIYNLFAFAGDPLTVGQALIDMSWSSSTNPKGTDIEFDRPVSNFSLRAGDFGSDDDSPLRIEAFDAAGVSLGVATADWPASASGSFAMLSLPFPGISRVHYGSGGFFPSSTFIDDVTFTVPAPAGPALATILCLRPRRRHPGLF